MRRKFQNGAAGKRGAGLILAVLLGVTGQVTGGDFPPGFDWQNLEFRTYAPHSTCEIADCKVQKIYVDHRKVGFFRVRLLPVLVVQGLSVEFGPAAPTNDWPESFHCDWLPQVRNDTVEWRDVDIGSQKAGAPHLHADSAEPSTGTLMVCAFKGVTLQVNGVTQRVARAELRNEAGRPCVIWRAGSRERQLDLFSGEITNTKK